VLEGARVLAQHLNRFQSVDLPDAIRQLKYGPAYLAGYDFDAAAALLQEFGVEVFLSDGDPRQVLRDVILVLASHQRPTWSRVAVSGRRRVIQVLSENEHQCLAAAGLVGDTPSSEVIEWWDRLALAMRNASDASNLSAGRSAERLSLEYEQKRLREEVRVGLQPKWLAFEDNTLGYDLQSFLLREGTLLPLYIEVKGSSAPGVRFFVTKAEWETSLRLRSQYLFHVWDLRARRLTILTPSDLVTHIPLNQGVGQWTTAEFSLHRLGRANEPLQT
jgi:hypothetical protein